MPLLTCYHRAVFLKLPAANEYVGFVNALDAKH